VRPESIAAVHRAHRRGAVIGHQCEVCMSIRIVSVVALCLALGMAAAQDSPRFEPPSQAAQMERLTVLLELNEAQKVEVAKVLADQREQMMAFRKQAKESGQRPSREQMETQREQMRSGLIDKLRPILTDQQLQKFEALGPMGPGPGPGRPDRR
jgi:Spy/CpxP family protein refolding chaperone